MLSLIVSNVRVFTFILTYFFSRQLKVQLGDYSYLRNLLDSIGAAKVSKEVLKMEQEIRAMMGQQAPRFVKPNPPPHEPMQVEEAKLLRSSGESRQY